MSEDHDPDLQDWFNRGVQELPRQPFTMVVVDKVRRKERSRRLLRSAALAAVVFSMCLLLPELIKPLGVLAELPVRMIAARDEYWPLLVPPVAGIVYWFVTRVRNRGFLSGN